MSPSDEATHLHRTTIRHTLSTRFVEIDQPATEEFECGGVIVRVDARVRESTSFATIVCSGTVEREAADASMDPGQYLPFLSSDGLPSAHTNEVHSAWSRIEPVLQHVGAVLRWRFGMFGDDPLWTSTDIVLQVNGEVDELTPIPQAAMGDDIARITSNGLSHVAELVGHSTMQPLRLLCP